MDPNDSNSIKNSSESSPPSSTEPVSFPSFPSPPSEDEPPSNPENSQTEKIEKTEKIEPQPDIFSDSAKEPASTEDVMDYFKHHKESIFTYILLILGITCLIFDAFLLGSLLIGLIAGYHFSHEIVFYLRNLNKIFEGQEQTRYIVLTAILVAFFIAIPGIFIGALVAGVFKYVIYENKE